MNLSNKTKLLLCLAILIVMPATAQDNPSTTQKEGRMTARATGEFEVKLTPTQPVEGSDPDFGGLVLDKKFNGDLEAISKGQMLGYRTPTEGSAGYVAMERVTGMLAGRKGSFVLLHGSTMDRGAQHQNIMVVPDSGTDELTGLTGKMVIIIADGKHSYEFDYSLPESK